MLHCRRGSLDRWETLGINGYVSTKPVVSHLLRPAPGAYDAPIAQVGLNNVEKAALFGRSRATREIHAVKNEMVTAIGNPLAQEPVIFGVGDGRKRAEILGEVLENGYEDVDQGGYSQPIVRGDGQGSKERISNVRGGGQNEVSGVEARSMLLSARAHSKANVNSSPPPPTAESRGDRKKPTIVWRRKFIPPSIPVGHSAFGYQENEDGELIPRKPPKRKEDPGPAYNFNTSFVERAKLERHGYTFGKDEKGLKFKIQDSPGPCLYNAEASIKYLHGNYEIGTGPALMTLAPCTRLTDAIVAEEKKKGVPGPGAYDVKLSFQVPRSRNTVIPAFGGTASHSNINYIPIEQMKTPGPGSYYPELANLPKPFLFKPQPFGSTTSRFDVAVDSKIKHLPAPGSYELDAIDSIIGKIHKKNNAFIGSRSKPFGSISERFSQKMPPQALDPGPGAYDIERQLPKPRKSDIPIKSGRMGTAQIGGMSSRNGSAEKSYSKSAGRRRPASKRITVVVGGIPVDPAKVRISAFGTQTQRFQANGGSEIPPPGAYQIAESFEAGPGPGEYDINGNTLERPAVKHGAFLSSEDRFNAKAEPVPGPGAYLSPEYDNGLLRKTFNITLREWHQTAVA
ncbi:hypothetical protein BC829DRAFT_440870 [Chytridium lagenaria]|nr:hypothetical protein BC829DRAFT_440870 [Chytridium lagenaria]